MGVKPRRRRGILAIELLFALPLLMALLLAMVQFSVLISAQQQVTAAAREAARVAALGGSPQDVRTTVDRFLGPCRAAVSATFTTTSGDPIPAGDPVEVIVQIPTGRMVPEFLGFIGFSMRNTKLTAVSVMRKE
jgi:hypothetical protein